MNVIECWPEETVPVLIGLSQEDEVKLKPLDGGKIWITVSKRRHHAGEALYRMPVSYEDSTGCLHEGVQRAPASIDAAGGCADNQHPGQGQPGQDIQTVS